MTMHRAACIIFYIISQTYEVHFNIKYKQNKKGGFLYMLYNNSSGLMRADTWT